MEGKSYKDRDPNNGFYPGDIVRHKKYGTLYMVASSYAFILGQCGHTINADHEFHTYLLIPITEDFHPDLIMRKAWNDEIFYELVSEQSVVVLQNILYSYCKWIINGQDPEEYNKIFNSIKIEL